MPYYETVFIARQDLTDGQVKSLTEKYQKTLEDNGAKILKTEQWGLRKLAYKINKSRKGHYILIESDANGPAVAELERLMGLDEDIMRKMTIRLDAPSETQSAILIEPEKKTRRYNKEAA